jgi:hypothetical protein
VDGFFLMIVIIVFLSLTTGTIHKYLDHRVRMAEARGTGGDRNLVRAIQELREEIAALRKQETEAVLSFDSTLQNLGARMQHLEHYTLGDGAMDRAALEARSRRPVEERAA